MQESAITKDHEIMGGVPCFRNTRIPVKIVFDYLEGGDRLEDFLEEYPSITHEQAIAVLQQARVSLFSTVS